MTGYFWFHRHCAGFVFAPLLNEALVVSKFDGMLTKFAETK